MRYHHCYSHPSSIAEAYAYAYPPSHLLYRQRPQPPQPGRPRPEPRPEPKPKLQTSPKPEYVYVWPKDPQPGNPRHWGRLKRFTDVLTGKGPDIFVEKRTPRAKSTPDENKPPKRENKDASPPVYAYRYGPGYGQAYARAHSHNFGNNNCYHGVDPHATVFIDGEACGRRDSRSEGRRPDIIIEERRPRVRRVYVPQHGNSIDGYESDKEVLINGKPCSRRAKSDRGGGKDGDKGGPSENKNSGRDWALWNREHLKSCSESKCDECEGLRAQEKRDNLFPSARRDPEERYDFRTRKYAVPDKKTWSKVVYCGDPKHRRPKTYWNRHGRPEDLGHDKAYGPH